MSNDATAQNAQTVPMSGMATRRDRNRSGGVGVATEEACQLVEKFLQQYFPQSWECFQEEVQLRNHGDTTMTTVEVSFPPSDPLHHVPPLSTSATATATVTATATATSATDNAQLSELESILNTYHRLQRDQKFEEVKLANMTAALNNSENVTSGMSREVDMFWKNSIMTLMKMTKDYQRMSDFLGENAGNENGISRLHSFNSLMKPEQDDNKMILRTPSNIEEMKIADQSLRKTNSNPFFADMNEISMQFHLSTPNPIKPEITISPISSDGIQALAQASLSNTKSTFSSSRSSSFSGALNKSLEYDVFEDLINSDLPEKIAELVNSRRYTPTKAYAPTSAESKPNMHLPLPHESGSASENSLPPGSFISYFDQPQYSSSDRSLDRFPTANVANVSDAIVDEILQRYYVVENGEDASQHPLMLLRDASQHLAGDNSLISLLNKSREHNPLTDTNSSDIAANESSFHLLNDQLAASQRRKRRPNSSGEPEAKSLKSLNNASSRNKLNTLTDDMIDAALAELHPQ